MKNKDKFWKNKKVFITGINGFVGGNLCKKLLYEGAIIHGLIRNQKKDTFIYYEKLHKKLILHNGDLCDKELISRIISEEQISYIFHLAAQVEVGIGLINPYLTFETNIRGTYTLLEVCRSFSNQINSIIIASSDKSYGSYSKEKMPYKEDYPLIPKFPYDVSKACGDLITQAYSNSNYNLPIAITRFCNIYGPGQLNFSAIFPDAIRSSLNYSTFLPRSDGTMTRDFLYIDDVSELYSKIAIGLENNPELTGEIFNAGPNDPISVREIIEKIYILANNTNDLEIILKQMKNKKTDGEIDYQCMDYEKIHKIFGWKPETNLDNGIQKTINWYKLYFKNFNSINYN